MPVNSRVLFAATSILAAAAAFAAHAKTPPGVSFPPTMTVDGKTLSLNGTGTRTISYFVDAYASALYLAAPAHTVQAVLAEPDPKVVVTKYLHPATVEQSEAEYKRVNKAFCAANPCTPQGEASFQQVLDHLKPVHVGDSSTSVFEGGAVSTTFDGGAPFVIKDPDYARGTLAAILGPSAPTADYASGLLGK